MGLAISHDAWQGAYSAFTRWRNRLAEVAGYKVWPVRYDDGSVLNTVMIDWGHLPSGALMGEWPETPTDPLIVLIAHADDEGVIKPEQTASLADRIEELLPLLLDEDGGGHIGNWRTTTEQFIAGCRTAVEADEPLRFS